MMSDNNDVKKKPVVRLMELSQDEQMRMLCESQQKVKRDYESRLKDVREKALADGEKTGRIYGKEEVTLNLLKLRVDKNDIIKATGLSEEALAILERKL